MKVQPLWFVCCGASTALSCGTKAPTKRDVAPTVVQATATETHLDASVAVYRDRLEFARAMAKVEPGMTAKQVRELLGPPEDTVTADDPGAITATRTTAIWRYGTEGHLSFATLGSVHMMANGRVQYVFGGKAAPPPASTFGEHALRDLLRILNRVPSYNSGSNYNALAVVRAVNALQPLGKRKAIAVIGEYLRVSSWLDNPGREGMFLVLRTLFDVPDDPGFMPAMMVGAPSPSRPADARVLPRFPVVLEGDVPLLIVGGYLLGGLPEPPEWHLEKFRNSGVIRRAPLHPTDAPFELAQRLVGSASTPFMRRTGYRTPWIRLRLMQQILQMASSVFRDHNAIDSESYANDADLDRRWRETYVKAKALPATWDAVAQRYTFDDGTVLP